MWMTLLAGLLACGSTPPAPSDPAPAVASTKASTNTSSEHATGDVVPGSHADWCGEHAVPESQCTRCNTALIPAFKATGDWCGEHGLPHSQCTACDPDLVIERPAKDG